MRMLSARKKHEDKCIGSHHYRSRPCIGSRGTSQSLSRNSESRMQNHLDEVNTWADNNLMKLNPKKCKEMHVCFLKERPILERLNLRGHPLEIVSHHKVLGFVIQDNLKWNGHIAMIVKKASKRFHILRVLKRGGIPPHELILI